MIFSANDLRNINCLALPVNNPASLGQQEEVNNTQHGRGFVPVKRLCTLVYARMLFTL